MTNKLTATSTTVRGKGTHSTLETVEDMFFPTQMHFKASVTLFPTYFTDTPLYAFIFDHGNPHSIILRFDFYKIGTASVYRGDQVNAGES